MSQNTSVIQIEKFARCRAAKIGEFLDHHTSQLPGAETCASSRRIGQGRMLMVPFIIAFWGMAAIAAAAVALFKAPRTGRNGQSWAFWSFIFPPVVGLLFVLGPNTLPQQPSQLPPRPPLDFDD
jgi:hypothetical protein